MNTFLNLIRKNKFGTWIDNDYIWIDHGVYLFHIFADPKHKPKNLIMYMDRIPIVIPLKVFYLYVFKALDYIDITNYKMEQK